MQAMLDEVFLAPPESDDAVANRPRVDRLADINTRIDNLQREIRAISHPAWWPKRLWEWVINNKGTSFVLAIMLCAVSVFGGGQYKYWLDHRNDGFNDRVKKALDAP